VEIEYTNPEALLDAMFSADRSIGVDAWLERFGYFDLNAMLRCRPWWEPLPLVWFCEGEGFDRDESAELELLGTLHRDWLART
jgi:hypothetical protein